MRGLNNKNPLNIRHNKDLFQGEVRPSRDRDFKEFERMEYGYRAAFVTLGTYLQRGLDSVEKIVSAWAPSNENDTGAYIDAVVRLSGVARDHRLTSGSGSEYVRIVAAMSRVENGVDAVMGDVMAGFVLQNKIDYGLEGI
jgi:hypothetical protein